jgi:hypothetical protein
VVVESWLSRPVELNTSPESCRCCCDAAKTPPCFGQPPGARWWGIDVLAPFTVGGCARGNQALCGSSGPGETARYAAGLAVGRYVAARVLSARWLHRLARCEQCVSARWSASARVAGGRGLLPGERDPKRCVRVGWSASPSAVGDSVLPSRGARSEAVRLCRVERLTIDRRTIHESPLSREIRAVRRRASPLLTVARRLCRGMPSFTRRSRLRCAHPPSAVSRAMGASSTTSRSPANPYQCLVPGFALANLVSGLAHTTISDRSTRADHPGVRIKS